VYSKQEVGQTARHAIYTTAISSTLVATYLDETSSKECDNDGNNVDSQLELKELCDAVVDIAAPHHRLHDTREIVVGQNDIGRFLRDVCACDSLQ